MLFASNTSNQLEYCVNLQFTENALRVIVEEGIAIGTGARGLRSILERILTEAMFEAADFNVEAVSEEDVQQALLKMLEGTEYLLQIISSIVSVADNRAWKHPRGNTIQIDTEDFLFICGGAFVGLGKTISERRPDSTIEFIASVSNQHENWWSN